MDGYKREENPPNLLDIFLQNEPTIKDSTADANWLSDFASIIIENSDQTPFSSNELVDVYNSFRIHFTKVISCQLPLIALEEPFIIFLLSPFTEQSMIECIGDHLNIILHAYVLNQDVNLDILYQFSLLNLFYDFLQMDNFDEEKVVIFSIFANIAKRSKEDFDLIIEGFPVGILEELLENNDQLELGISALAEAFSKYHVPDNIAYQLLRVAYILFDDSITNKYQIIDALQAKNAILTMINVSWLQDFHIYLENESFGEDRNIYCAFYEILEKGSYKDEMPIYIINLLNQVVGYKCVSIPDIPIRTILRYIPTPSHVVLDKVIINLTEVSLYYFRIALAQQLATLNNSDSKEYQKFMTFIKQARIFTKLENIIIYYPFRVQKYVIKILFTILAHFHGFINKFTDKFILEILKFLEYDDDTLRRQIIDLLDLIYDERVKTGDDPQFMINLLGDDGFEECFEPLLESQEYALFSMTHCFVDKIAGKSES